MSLSEASLIQIIDDFPKDASSRVNDLSLGLKLFQKEFKISIPDKEIKFLQKFMAKSKVSQASSHQILKSWVSAGLRRDSDFSVDFDADMTADLLMFYLEKRLLYLSNFQDLVVDGNTELVRLFIENGITFC